MKKSSKNCHQRSRWEYSGSIREGKMEIPGECWRALAILLAFLQAVEPQTFLIREVDLKRTVTIPYSEVDRVRKNYGGKGFGGRRVDPKKNLIFIAVSLGALLTILIVALAKDKS